MKETALLIIDVQVAMFTKEAKQPYNGDQMLKNIQLLLEKARQNKLPVVYVQHNKEDSPFASGSPSWQIHPAIAPLAGEPVVHKTFCDSFYKTNLQEVLNGLGIKKLIIVGMQSDFCVDTTTRRALSSGYESILVKDAHSTFSTKILDAQKIVEHHNFVLGSNFAKLMTTQEVLELI